MVAGIDVGGTFTDLLLVDRRNGGGMRVVKTLSTPDNQAFGIINALNESGVALAELDTIIHGTTTTTNAVLERKLAVTGMITTRGFRDVIEVGRRTRPQAYGMFGAFQPVIPRARRIEVTERIDAGGGVVTPLDEAGVRDAARRLLEAGCESIVVHFLHAYANPAHEQRAVEVLRELWPNDFITAGHELLSEYREYERGVTASVNASVRPFLHRYVDLLQKELNERGFRRDLLIMNGNGGMVSARQVDRDAAKTVMSGPASGVMAAAYTAKRGGFENLITYDMGGTSTDVALVLDAVPAVSSELEIEYAMPIHVPMVDVRTIGGGSIAKGHDPRDFTLFAFGGAGPLHATALAAELGIPRVLIPARPGITNALGCVVADIRHDFVRTVNRPLDHVDMDHIHDILAQQVEEGRRLVEAKGIGVEPGNEVRSDEDGNLLIHVEART